jgi:hypothetical protein
MELRLGSDISEPLEEGGSSAQMLLLVDTIWNDPRWKRLELLFKQRKRVAGVPSPSFAHHVNTRLILSRKDGIIFDNMDYNVIHAAAVTSREVISYPPPTAEVQAIAVAKW